MKLFWILLCILAVMILLSLLIAYICYRKAFYAPKKKNKDPNAYPLPRGKIYDEYRESMIGWIREMREMPHETFEITSFDGLKLRGNYYEFKPGAPIELMFHGYRSCAESDLCGGIRRCRRLGRSALIVDQRACGSSEGHVISFGINEHRDCLKWIDFMVDHFGPEVKILLCGISMGAATVTIAAGQKLPKNVIGMLADCGYTSAKEMIEKTIGEMKLPPKLMYPFVRLGARVFGHFDLDEISPIEAAAHCTVPAVFIHGEADIYVPCDMSRRNYEACTARKALLTVPGAGHGLSYPKAPEEYRKILREFFGPEASAPISPDDPLSHI